MIKAHFLPFSQRERLLQTLADRGIPSTEPAETRVSPNLISNSILELPRSLLTQVKELLESLDAISQSRPTKKKILEKFGQPTSDRYSPFSIFMCADFHVTTDGLRLIEINTNASLYGLSSILYENLGNDSLATQQLKLDIETERGPLSHVLIVDQNPAGQKLKIEFEIFQNLFRSWGWNCDIQDSLLANEGYNWIYNRDTDFYLNDSPALKKIFETSAVLSPHPLSYFAFADKYRLCDFSNFQFLKALGLADTSITSLQKIVPRTFPLTSANANEAWDERRNLFFKPANSFGSKSAYRGSSISHKRFRELIDQGNLAQEFIPAATVQIENSEYYFDLRVYFYKTEIRGAIARLYQGQLTNSRTPGGGIAPIRWIK